MRIDELERELAAQHSALQAFPSQGPTLDQMFSGQNQRASVELQIKTAKILASQHENLEKANAVLNSLLKRAEEHQISLKVREKVDDQRYRENTRFSRVAAWAGVVSVILTAVGIAVQLLLVKWS